MVEIRGARGIGAAVGFALLACVSPFFSASSAGADADAPGVIVAEAAVVSFPLTLTALGTTRANESIEVRPKVSDVITAIRFEEGQHVEAGQILVELDDVEALADLAAVRANLVDLENQVRRSRELLKTNAIAASEIDQRVAQRDAARAALAAAESRLADRKVRAPFAGDLGLRRVSVGSLVTPDTVITTLDDTDVIKLDFDVPATAISQLEPGLAVRARSAAWRDVVFRGEIATVDTRVDPVSRSIMTRALLPNDERRLRPGMFLSVEILREDVQTLVVPEEAIVPEESRQYVIVVDGDRAGKREVKTGRRRPGQVEIVSGLAPGERVIVEGTQKVRDGTAVRIVGERAVEAPGVSGQP